MQVFTTTRLSQVVKYNYYKVLCEKMKHRKEIIRDNRKIKGKLEKQALPYTLRAEDYIRNNQKKCIAFLGVLAVMQYYHLFHHVYKYVRSIEPPARKFKRWFLGEDNLLPSTITEQAYIVSLSPANIEILEKLYQYLEKQFLYGVNRKFLYTIYDELQLFDKPEERLSFYRQSGYFKKRNQKLCAVHCQQFVVLFDEAMTKLKKKDPYISEDDFLRQFSGVALDKIDFVQKWERNIDTKRSEYKKLTPHLQDHKTRRIKQLLEQDPYISFEDIDRKLSDIGCSGMSIKDKLMINFQQLQLHEVIKDSYLLKLDKYAGSTKEIKLSNKVAEWQEKVNFYKERQASLNLQFNKLFKKQELFPT